MRNLFLDKEKIMDMLPHHRGKLIGMLVGLAFSLLVIFIGVIKTLFMAICVYCGYLIGKKIDNQENLWELFDKILPPRYFK